MSSMFLYHSNPQKHKNMKYKKTEITPVPKADLQDSRWINTPFAYTRLGADFSLLQQEIMLKVSDALQEYVRKFYDAKRYQQKEKPKPLFFDEPIPPVRIQLADLTIDDNHYKRLESVRKEIQALDIMAPDIDSDGQPVMKWMPVFDEVSLPFVPGGYNKRDKETGDIVTMLDRRRGYMDFSINPKVAQYAFDMTEGYVNHMKMIAAYSRRQSTPRIYLFLRKAFTSDTTRGADKQEVRVLKTVREVKEYLGVIEHFHLIDDNDQAYEETRDKYPKFSRFCKEVLDKAKEDLLRMAPLNQTDIIFDYVPIYKGTRRRGDPDFIEFRIRLSNLGKNRDVLLHRESVENRLLRTLLKKCPDLDQYDLQMFISSIASDDLVAFQNYAYKEAWYIIENVQPDDVASYLMQLFRTWKKKAETPKNERRQPKQLSLFADQEAREQFDAYIDDIVSSCVNEANRERFRQMRFDAFDNNVLTIAIPDKSFHEWLEQDATIRFLQPIFSRHYKADTLLQYRIIPPVR